MERNIIKWKEVCRICLQEGKLRSIFENDEELNVSISDKIMRTSNITIQRGMNLPEKICEECINDLNIAYRFRTNCENSDTILQQFLENTECDENILPELTIISSKSGNVYTFKPPAGLDIKRVKPISSESVVSPSSPGTAESIDIKIEKLLSEDEDSFVNNDDCDDDYVPKNNKSVNEKKKKKKQQKKTPKKGSTRKSKSSKKENTEEFELIEKDDAKAMQSMKAEKHNDDKCDNSKTTKTQNHKVHPAKQVTIKSESTALIRILKREEEKPKKICEICGNTYKYKHALESHMRRHRNEKPFACEICGRAFVINFELRRHMRVHTGQKPYMCRYCERRFSDFGSRIKHERTHTGERPYVCETCGKAFSYSHVLQSHILTHTGEKRFECMSCGKRFTKSHHLKAHMNTHNKNNDKKSDLIKTPKEFLQVVNHEIEPFPTVWTESSSVVHDILQPETIVHEQKVYIQSNDNEKIYLHTGDYNKVFLIKEKKEVEEDLTFTEFC